MLAFMTASLAAFGIVGPFKRNATLPRLIPLLSASEQPPQNIATLPDLLRKVRPDDNIQAVGNLSDERHEAEDTTPNDEP